MSNLIYLGGLTLTFSGAYERPLQCKVSFHLEDQFSKNFFSLSLNHRYAADQIEP
ncbi:hypothetical protein KDK82_1873 [Delftia sp. K82]|nr:hypothetical protein KDK82_1873 [Delftia sp. K82]